MTTSRWIRWPGYLAWVFLATLVLAVLTVRSGAWQQGLLLYALAALLSLVVLAALGGMSLLPAFSGQRQAIALRALPAIPGTVLLLMALQARDVPPIHDITTDTVDPPTFEQAPSLRGEDSNPLDIKPDVIAQQREAYPQLATLRSERRFPEVYAAARETAAAMGWEITRDDPNAGYIEAVDRTTIMNFADDVVVRVRTGEDGSLVDLRSVSRVGVSDLGANAARIERFLAQLTQRLAP